MKLTITETTDLHWVRGPQPHNKYGPYFDEGTIKVCRKDVFRVLYRFSTEDVKYLMAEIQSGRVNGSFSETDLLGTLTRLPKGERAEKRLELYALVGIDPKHLNSNVGSSTLLPFEYWFRQIAGDKTTGQAEQIRKISRKRLVIRKSIRSEFGKDSPLLGLLKKEEATEKSHVKICLFTQTTIKWCSEYIRQTHRPYSGTRGNSKS